MISINNLNVSIQKVPILRDINMQVDKGAMVGLIGRNGAGKTTLMRSVMGVLRPDSGQILVQDKDITNIGAHIRANMHIGYMPEDRRLVPSLTVEENILLPIWAVKDNDFQKRLQWVYELMPEVAKFSSRMALSLSGGQQKLVALARALMIGEKILLLDEPFEGVAPSLCMRLVEVISSLKQEGISVLISESDYTYTSGVVDVSYVIERGRISNDSQ